MWAPEHDLALGSDGIIDIAIRGVWQRADVDRFFADFIPLHAQARAARGRVLALVHVAAVQSPATALYVRERALVLKGERDRTAMVVLTMLSRLQIERVGGSERFGAFTDAAAARRWLLDETPPRAATR